MIIWKCSGQILVYDDRSAYCQVYHVVPEPLAVIVDICRLVFAMQLGNELFQVIFWLSTRAFLGSALMDRLQVVLSIL